MIEEKTFLTFIDYFRSLATSHVDILDFVHGGTREIAQISKSNITYPAMWLETPSILPRDNNLGNARLQWRTGLAILQSNGNRNESLDSDVNPNLSRDTLFNDTLLISQDIIRAIKKDFRDAEQEFKVSTVSLDPIDTVLLDDLIGWRLQLAIDFNFSLAYNAAKFT